MSARNRLFIFTLAIVALGAGITAPAHAQGKGNGKHYSVSSDKAMSVTRTVLQRQGYEVVRVVHADDAQVIYYRRGNNGRGKGKGPVERLVIRLVERRVVFEEAPPAILVDIDFNLKL
jgi:hypothetical protein